MRYTIEILKDDLKFINAVVVKSYGYGVENIRVRYQEGTLLFEATDTHMLLRRRFEAEKERETDPDPDRDLLFSPEFFKRLIYLCKQKEIINITVDFEKLKITGKTLFCEITSHHVAEARYPNTDGVFPVEDGDIEIVFRKEILEKFLNSLPTSEPFIKMSFRKSDEPWNEPIVVRTSVSTKEWTEERNLIMGVKPNVKQW
jgi:hypothetical protein